MNDISSAATKHLEHLSVKIGPRPLGSKRNQAAAEYIRGVFKANGLETELQEFPCLLWEDNSTRLELDGTRYVAAANVFSPPCDVATRGVAVGTLAELKAADLAGRIGILYGDLTTGTGYSTQSAFYFPERDEQILNLLREKKPAALITIHSHTGSLQRLISDWKFPIPSATVPAEVGLMLLRQIDRPLHLRVESEGLPNQFCNVVGTKAGTRRARIVLSAHFDTTADAPGAIDNGSGVAAMLALVEALTQEQLPLGLEFVALNGEENGSVGSAEYLRRREGELAQVVAAINLDGVGQTLGANSIATFPSSQSFRDQVSAICRKYPGVIQVNPWYESDHTAFLTRGVPSIAVSSTGVTNVMHLPVDTIEWISAAKLGEVVSLVTEIVEGLQDKSLEWGREKAA